MSYKCCIVHCRSNYSGEEPIAIFAGPKYEEIIKDASNLSTEKIDNRHHHCIFLKSISKPSWKGGKDKRRVSVTNRNLKELCKEKKFFS